MRKEFPADPGKFNYQVWTAISAVAGTRYLYLPSLVFAWSLIYALRTRLKWVAVVLAGIMTIGIVRDFRAPALPDGQFNAYVTQFRQAPPGSSVVIPIAPAGWKMILIKHRS